MNGKKAKIMVLHREPEDAETQADHLNRDHPGAFVSSANAGGADVFQR